MTHLEELFGLRGRRAIVTGASSGLGLDAARALAKGGADLGLVARRADRLESLASELRDEFGIRACAAPADVTDTTALEDAFAKVESELGPLDILLGSAGIAELGRAERHTREKWDRVLAVNLTAAFESSQIMARRLIERGSPGRIIHVSSAIGRGANPVHRAVGYSASKAGLENLVRHLAVEWAQHGILVNAIAPSYFPTEMTVDPEIGDVRADQKERMETFTPLGRLGRAGELETAVLFLAAPASSYVTGAVIPVDGGWTAW
jgi:NAD(P)-dependent dehydrogenase (short-subunit alcohol dehydrogenase family)